MNALDRMNNVREKLLSVKQENGQSIFKLLKSYNENGCFKGVKLLKSNSDVEKFELLRCQFYQSTRYFVAVISQY